MAGVDNRTKLISPMFAMGWGCYAL